MIKVRNIRLVRLLAGRNLSSRMQCVFIGCFLPCQQSKKYYSGRKRTGLYASKAAK